MTLSFDPNAVALPQGHHIGGTFRPAEGEIAMHRPSDGAGIAASPRASAELVDEAVTAARAAWRASNWGGGQPRDRTRALHRWADLIEARAGELARAEAVVSTRPIAQIAAGDIAIGAEMIRFFGEFADKEGSALVPTRDDQTGMIMSEPYGVVGAITPWNFPIQMAVWKLAPALAAGNAVVIKPSEMTPYTTLMLAELAVEAGIPPGLIGVVLGDGPVTGAALTAHPGIAKVSFTGSTGAGAAIMANVARTGIRPVTLELGGKSPLLVFADADLDLAAGAAARSILGNAGQACVAGSRAIVAAEVAEPFAAKVMQRMAGLVAGPTWDEASTYSPVISRRQIDRIDSIVSAALDRGAEALCGGAPMDRPGWFYQPTLLTGLSPDSPAIAEEIFGPVLTLQTFETDEEALALADHPTYGLAAGVFTRDLSRALRVTKALQAGTVWVNRYGRSRDHILPTGGYKQSGVGKDLGREAYLLNRRAKSVLIDL